MSASRFSFVLAWTLCAVVPLGTPAFGAEDSACEAFSTEKVPQSFDGCTPELERLVTHPGEFFDEATRTFKLAEYEKVMNDYMEKYCYRDTEGGKWIHDKWIRDTGPYVSLYEGASWPPAAYYGTHAPVVIWYNKVMYDWLKAHRGEGETNAEAPVIPDGAMMIKEMYPAPAARCAAVKEKVHYLVPTNGVALMVRDNQNAHDGWFWGSWGEPWFNPDWPAVPKHQNRLPYMGFGQYCLNCHASAVDNQTFADLKNIRGEPGHPNVYLSQNFLFTDHLVGKPPAGRHEEVSDTTDDPVRYATPLADDDLFASFFDSAATTAKTVGDLFMPSQTYDNVWVPGPAGLGERAGPESQFITSDQCLGCHDAGSTGLQFDMTAPDVAADTLLNLSPYGTWRTSPMGLGGRDPIFYAQLASETETFHPEFSPEIQDTCLGCHGILGQRQYKIDHGGDATFLREFANAVPYPSNSKENPMLDKAPYGSLARDGISCTSCHHTVLTEEDTEKNEGEKWNEGVAQRQEFLAQNVNAGFAKTFTGSFFVGPPDNLYGPFEDPKTLPMEHGLGIVPEHAASIRNSGVCGTCHTVYLPILYEGETLGHTYEQTTYPEWAFSAYRTGADPWRPSRELPTGAGSLAQSCQDCHMPSRDADGDPYVTKIASIQEYSNFPATDNVANPEDVDLEVREAFARHTLVGLNVFFVEMAKQFPDVLGIRTQDPMMVDRGLDPVLFTERAMLEQASAKTARVRVSDVEKNGGTLKVKVSVESDVGHKFPSGVSFRRAFLELAVLDGDGRILWASGRTDEHGLIVDEKGEPIAGELFWKPDCSGRVEGTAHQPHYEEITDENQAQIYQELVVAPPDGRDPAGVRCGDDYTPGGLFTTSFLSICGHVKDNRILPHGFLSVAERAEIAKALGVEDAKTLAKDSGPHGRAAEDPDYREGGGDTLEYAVDLSRVDGEPAHVRATLYYQATPPFYLQDRFCTSKSVDTQRLFYLAGHLDLDGSRAEDWKLKVVSSGLVAVD